MDEDLVISAITKFLKETKQTKQIVSGHTAEIERLVTAERQAASKLDIWLSRPARL